MSASSARQSAFTLLLKVVTRNSITLGETGNFKESAFLRTIFLAASTSGGSKGSTMPHSKRLMRRGSLEQFRGEAIGADDNLLAGEVKRVKRVEKLLLGGPFAGENMHIVDDQDIYGAVRLAKSAHFARADGRDHMLGKFLRADIAHIHSPVSQCLCHSHQVGGFFPFPKGRVKNRIERAKFCHSRDQLISFGVVAGNFAKQFMDQKIPLMHGKLLEGAVGGELFKFDFKGGDNACFGDSLERFASLFSDWRS